MSGLDSIRTEDGWDLSIDVRAADGEPWALAVCGHAMMCNRKTYDRPRGQGVAQRLTQAGIETVLLDLRGHGESRRADRNDYTYDDFIHQDIPAVCRALRQRYPDLPLIWIGHSLSGHAAVAALSCEPTLPVDAVVSLAGNVWIKELEPGRWMWLLKRTLSEAWMAVSRLSGRFPTRFLRMGTDDEALDYVRQMTGFSRSGTWGSLDGRWNYLERMHEIRVPILSLVGEADTWMCRPESPRFWLAHAANAHVTHRLIGERTGDPSGVDHMGLVLRTDMAPVWDETIAWMRQVVGLESSPNA